MSTPNEPKYYQHLELHMKNGEVVHVYEDYDIPVEDGIVGDFKKKKKNKNNTKSNSNNSSSNSHKYYV